MSDWAKIIESIFEPRDYIKRPCPIDGKLMKKNGDTYRCPDGHSFTKGKSVPDHLIEETKGDFHGEI